MVKLNLTTVTRISFYSPSLPKQESVTGSWELTDRYSGTVVGQASGAGVIGRDGFTFRHRITMNTQNFDLVSNRTYDLEVKDEDGNVIYRDVAIATDQDISHETDHEFQWNHDQYKYLDRGTVNKYKVLTR